MDTSRRHRDRAIQAPQRSGAPGLQREFNTIFSKIRAAVEHAVAKVKTWRMLSREGGRYRCPIDKFESMLAAVTGLFFFAEYSND